MARDNVERLIQDKGGPQNLDLSGYDLSEIDLSEMDLHGAVFGTEWRTPQHGTACLKGARFTRTDLSGANFIHVDLSGISFYGCDLHDATLGVANCTDASFKRANLQGVNFHGARLSNTDFAEADLRDSDFHSAFIGDINLVDAKIGDRLLFEDATKLEAFLRRHEVDPETIAARLATRFMIGQKTYLTLKTVFLSRGQYSEASRAYIKERQMERKTHWPPGRARDCYSDESDGTPSPKLKRLWKRLKFVVRHLGAYLLDWLAELTCGYGERPWRTIAWALATIFVFPVLYMGSNGVVLATGGPMSWLDYLNYSFGAFTTTGFPNFATVNSLAQTLTSMEALLGISLLALLMFTLGHRISRS